MSTAESLDVAHTKPWFISHESKPAERTLSTREGATVAVVDAEDGERIQIRDKTNSMLLSIDPATGLVTISSERGNLALAAPGGDIELHARGALRFRGEKDVAIDAGESLQISSKRAAIALTDATYAGTRLRTKVSDVKNVVERLETVTERLFEKAKAAYRQVEELSQLRAGRVRTLVRGSYLVRGETTSIEARDDVKIDGKHIHLG
jgi:hypothetical protein